MNPIGEEMRILLVVPSLYVPFFKGSAKVGAELYKGLKERGFDIEVLEVYRENKSYLNNLIKVPFKQLRSKVDVIHAITPESGAFLGIIKMLKNVKTVVTFHDLSPLESSEKLKFKFKEFVKLYTFLMWKSSLNVDLVTVVSTQTKEEVVKYLGKPKRIAVINPGVDERFKPIKVKKEKITLGFFANFSYKKGVDKAIEVFKMVNKKIDCKLILAGGFMHTIFQEQFDVYKLTKGLKDVEIFGYVSEKYVVKLYNSFDFYLFPSIEEGFGIPILEAQKCGIPVLTFKWAKIPQETKEKTIQCKDVQDMANKILYLIKNREKYKKISRDGIKYASKFTWKNFVETHVNFYEDLVCST